MHTKTDMFLTACQQINLESQTSSSIFVSVSPTKQEKEKCEQNIYLLV